MLYVPTGRPLMGIDAVPPLSAPTPAACPVAEFVATTTTLSVPVDGETVTVRLAVLPTLIVVEAGERETDIDCVAKAPTGTPNVSMPRAAIRRNRAA